MFTARIRPPPGTSSRTSHPESEDDHQRPGSTPATRSRGHSPKRQEPPTTAVRQVLTETADAIERRDHFLNEHNFKPGAGGEVYSLLFEHAKRVVGWTAIEHLQRELGLKQLQHWRETNTEVVVAALRTAAGTPIAVDAEAARARAEYDALRELLSETLGFRETGDVVSIVNAVRRLRRSQEV